MRFLAIIAAMAFIIPSVAISADKNNGKRTAQGFTFLLCDNESTSAAVCDDADGDQFAVVESFDSLTFVFGEDGSGATCEAYGAGRWNSDGTEIDYAGTADLSTLSTDSLFSSSLSASQSRITLTNLDLYAVWVTCTDATSMDVSVEVRGRYNNPQSSR